MEKNGKAESGGTACGVKPEESAGRLAGKRCGEALKRQVVEEIEAGSRRWRRRGIN